MRSVFALILDELLQRMRDAGVVAETITPDLLDSYSPKDKQVIVTATNFDPNEELSCMGNPPAQAFDATVDLVCILRQNEKTNINSLEERLADFVAGVIQAVTTGDHWWTMGGNAIDTRVGSIEKSIESDGSMGSNTITLTIIYRHAENNPFIRR